MADTTAASIAAGEDVTIVSWPSLALGFDTTGGDWRWLEGHGFSREDWSPAGEGAAGFGLDGRPVVEPFRHLLEIRPQRKDPATVVVSIALGRTTVFRVCEAPAYRLDVYYRFDPQAALLVRWVRWRWLPRVDYYGFQQARLTGIWLGLPGFRPRDPEPWKVDVPWDRWLPGTALAERIALPRTHPEGQGGFYGLLSAPDHAPGAVTLRRDGETTGLTVYPQCTEVPVFPEVFGRDGALELRHEFGVARYAHDSATCEAGRQVIALHRKDRTAVRVTFEQCRELAGAPEPEAHWLGGATLAELLPGVEGGLAGVERRIERLREAGIDAVYLMPVTKGGYANLSQTELDPALGNEEDLVRLIERGHALGLRVILDLLLTITAPEAVLARAHPDWVIRDALGRPMPSISWGGYSIDWSHPGYHEHMLACARRWLADFRFDGFRVDAPMHKEANWNPRLDGPADRTAFGAVRFLAQLRGLCDAEFPEAGLLSEAPGPIFSRSCHACYDAPAYAMDWLKAGIEQGRVSGRELAEWLALRLYTCVDPARRVAAVKTHDIASDYGFGFRSHAALSTVLALLPCGFMTFFSIPRMRDESSAEYRLLAWLAHRRAQLRGRSGDDAARFHPQESQPGACVFTRPGAGLTVVSNLSPEALALGALEGLALPARVEIVSPAGEVAETAAPARLAPYATLVGMSD